MSKADKVNKFVDQLENNGDMFFSRGGAKDDYNHIKFVIDKQGYWAGESDRYYLDEDLNVTKVESRF